MMELPLIVGVEGSDPSLRAVDWAVDAAARYGLPLRLVHASLWEPYEGVPATGLQRPSARVMAEHVVASVAEPAHRRNLEVKVSTENLPRGNVARPPARGQQRLVPGDGIAWPG